MPDSYLPTGIISQKDFASKFRAKLSQLKNLTDDQRDQLNKLQDNQIVDKALQLRPDLTDKVENANNSIIQQRNADAQRKLEQQAQNQTQFARSVTSSLPGVGAILGTVAGSPTGPGAIASGALGAGAGRGLQDLVEQVLGLNQTTPMEKGINIGKDTLLTAMLPGINQAISEPIASARITAGGLGNIVNASLPRMFRPGFAEMLEDFANPVSKTTPVTSPDWLNKEFSELLKPASSVNPKFSGPK